MGVSRNVCPTSLKKVPSSIDFEETAAWLGAVEVIHVDPTAALDQRASRGEAPAGRDGRSVAAIHAAGCGGRLKRAQRVRCRFAKLATARLLHSQR